MIIIGSGLTVIPSLGYSRDGHSCVYFSLHLILVCTYSTNKYIYIWFEHDGPHDHLLADLDGPAHFRLVWLFRYFDP